MDEFMSMDEQPTCERWDPLGAANDETEDTTDLKSNEYNYCDHHYCSASDEKMRSLEDDHEVLNTSLFALISHFAQVQFRLRQVMLAPSDDKDNLLESLEEFSYRGIPDIILKDDKVSNLAESMHQRRKHQRLLLEQLNTELRELARVNKEAGISQETTTENQRVILKELKLRMNLELDEDKLCEMSPDDVKQKVDMAVGHLVTPLRMKEHLVAQLKTQVTDLERFIDHLQADTKKTKSSCRCALHSVKKPLKNNTMGMVHNTAAVLEMFALLQMGCGGPSKFKTNHLKSTSKCNHWGDLRAKLEMAIAKVIETVKKSKHKEGDYVSDSDSSSVVCNVKVTKVVRKHLAPTICDLMQHGACATGENHSLVPFIGCFMKKLKASDSSIHAWEIILEYYHLKNGERFNSTPARKLSQSFNLDIVGSSAVSNKQRMLSIIGNIISTHSVYKCNHDSHFKAFVCAALNANKLATWLSLIFQCRALIEMHYFSWSYVVKTGFSDGLRSLDSLSILKFDLPVDLAIRQFQNIQDAFT